MVRITMFEGTTPHVSCFFQFFIFDQAWRSCCLPGSPASSSMRSRVSNCCDTSAAVRPSPKADGASSVVGYWVMMVESMVKNGYTVIIHFFWIFEGDLCWGCNVSGIAMPWRTATWEWFWPFYGIGVYDWVFCITCAWLWSNLERFWWTTIYFCSSSYSKPFKLGLIIWRATTWAYCRFAGWV